MFPSIAPTPELDELTETLRSIEARQRALDAERAAAIRAWDRSRAWATDGSASPGARLARETVVSGRTARERVLVANLLVSMPVTDAAFVSLGWAKVRLLAGAINERTKDAFAAHEAMLVEEARRLSVDQLALLLAHWRRLVDEDGANADADSLHDGQYVQLATSMAGEGYLKGRLDPESNAIVGTVLRAIADEMFRSERRARCEAKMRGEDPGEMRTSSARAADALVEMARRAAATTAAEDSGATVTPAQPLVLVNIDVATELDADGEVRKVLSARLGDGTPISTQDAVRLACDAAVARVLTKRGVVPLQLGRLARDPSDGQRRALGAIWATCAHPSCDRPFAWCDLHHVLHWELGGRTDVDLLLPLCKHHHRMHHRDVFRIERRPDSTFLFKHADGTPIGAANPTISQLFAAARHITRAA